MQVALSDYQALVPEYELERPQVTPVCEEVDGKCVPQKMCMQAIDTTGEPQPSDHMLQAVARHRLAIRRQKKLIELVSARLRAVHVDVSHERLRAPLAERDYAFLLSLAEHFELTPLQV